jgi:hypothetical protein
MALAHSEKSRDTSGLANCHGGLFRFVFTTSFARYAVEEFKLKGFLKPVIAFNVVGLMP